MISYSHVLYPSKIPCIQLATSPTRMCYVIPEEAVSATRGARGTTESFEIWN